MKFMQEFKEFIARGNVMDMAVGVVIGGSFKGIVDSLVADVINPFIAFVTGTFSKALSSTAAGVGEQEALISVRNMSNWIIPGTSINIGNFLSSVINFLIMAFIIFCLVKFMNNLHSRLVVKQEEEEAEEAAAPTQEELLAEIRDLLKEQKEE